MVTTLYMCRIAGGKALEAWGKGLIFFYVVQFDDGCLKYDDR